MNHDFCTLCDRYLAELRTVVGELETGSLEPAEAFARLDAAMADADERSATGDAHVQHLWGLARYPLCATADDLVLRALRTDEMRLRWPYLEFRHFESAVGGAEFFALSERPAYAPTELRMLLHLCLAHGFEGEHAGVDRRLSPIPELRRRLIADLLRATDEEICPGAGIVPPFRPNLPPRVRVARAVVLLATIVVAFVVGANAVYMVKTREIVRAAETAPATPATSAATQIATTSD